MRGKKQQLNVFIVLGICFFQHGYFYSSRFNHRFARFHSASRRQNPTALYKSIFPRNIFSREGGGGGGKRNNKTLKVGFGNIWCL